MKHVNYNTTCKKSLENRLALQVCIKIGLEGNYQGLEIKVQLTCTYTSIPLKLHIIYTFTLKGFSKENQLISALSKNAAK